MNKEYFIKMVEKLSFYDKKEGLLAVLLEINSTNFILDMITDMGDMLITMVNPNLANTVKDSFYETFWDNLREGNEEDWGNFYDTLIKNTSKYS